MLSVMLNVANNPIMRSVVMLNVIMLSVVAPILNVAANLVIAVNVREIPYRK